MLRRTISEPDQPDALSEWRVLDAHGRGGARQKGGSSIPEAVQVLVSDITTKLLSVSEP
jgi:hypothetical protein